MIQEMGAGRNPLPDLLLNRSQAGDNLELQVIGTSRTHGHTTIKTVGQLVEAMQNADIAGTDDMTIAQIMDWHSDFNWSVL